jgi:uncharacterized protein YciI
MVVGVPGDHLLLYAYVPEILERRGPHREAHLARIHAERAAGRIGLAGAIGDPVSGGAIHFIDVTAADVEAFVAADPYVTAGLVQEWRILPWHLV